MAGENRIDEDPPIPWKGAFVNGLVAAVIAIIVGVPAYHFFADASWGDAFSASITWAIIAFLGAFVGQVLAHAIRRSS